MLAQRPNNIDLHMYGRRALTVSLNFLVRIFDAKKHVLFFYFQSDNLDSWEDYENTRAVGLLNKSHMVLINIYCSLLLLHTVVRFCIIFRCAQHYFT
jgi:hypothetical protein